MLLIHSSRLEGDVRIGGGLLTLIIIVLLLFWIF